MHIDDLNLKLSTQDKSSRGVTDLIEDACEQLKWQLALQSQLNLKLKSELSSAHTQNQSLVKRIDKLQQAFRDEKKQLCEQIDRLEKDS